MNTNHSIRSIVNYYVRDVKIALGLSFISGVLALITFIFSGTTLPVFTEMVLIYGFPFVTFSGYIASILLKERILWGVQAAKFSIIGGLSALIELSVLNTLFYFTGITSGNLFLVFKTLTFLTATVNSFFFNRHWTFKSTNIHVYIEFRDFLMSRIGGLVLNVGVAFLIVNVIGAPVGFSPTLWANIGVLTALFVTTIWNFFSSKFFVFRKKKIMI